MSLSSLEKYYNQFLKIQDKTVNTILDLVNKGDFTFCFPTPDRNDYAEIIDKLNSSIGNLMSVSEKPYITLKNEYELVHASKADKLSPKGIQMTIRDSSVWIDKDNPRPEYVYRKTFEEEYDSYENRVVRTLIDRLIAFINGPVLQARNAIKNLYDEYFQSDRLNKFDLIRIADFNTFILSENVFFKDFQKLYLLQSKLNYLKNTDFYKIMSKCPKFTGTPEPTNLFTHNTDYRACYLLWNYLDTCMKNTTDLNEMEISSLYSSYIVLLASSFLSKMGYKLIEDRELDEVLYEFEISDLIFNGDLFAISLSIEKNMLLINTLCKQNKIKQLTKVELKTIDDGKKSQDADYTLCLYPVEYSDNMACVTPNNENSTTDLYMLLKCCTLVAPVNEGVYTNICLVCGSNMLNAHNHDCVCDNCGAHYTFLDDNHLWLRSFKSALAKRKYTKGK